MLEYGEHQKEVSGGEADTTNNRMELKAVIEGLRLLKEPCDVRVVSDSSYVVKAINEWLAGWVKKKFAKVKNVDLWQEYLEVSQSHRVTGEWVKGHAGHPMNEHCDTIARAEAEQQKTLQI